MKALQKSMGMIALMAAMMDTTPSRNIDISMRKQGEDKSKPKRSKKKLEKAKAQKKARRRQRKS